MMKRAGVGMMLWSLLWRTLWDSRVTARYPTEYLYVQTKNLHLLCELNLLSGIILIYGDNCSWVATFFLVYGDGISLVESLG